MAGECGTISVPLDWDDPSSGTISIRFEWIPARAGVASRTIVAQDGGPGSPSTIDGGDFTSLFEPLRRDHNLLLMDERGTGDSTPIDCVALQALGASPVLASADETNEATAQCGYFLNHHFRARGHRGYVHASDLFSTAQSVRDLAAILNALRTGPVDLYGVSYGTFFAEYFTWRYPQLVRSLVLDSAYALDQDFFDLPAWRESRFALDAVCSRSASCAAAAPGSSNVRIRRLAAALERHPIRDGIRAFDLDDLGNVIESAGTNFPFAYLDLDAAARAWLERGDAVPLDRLRRLSLMDSADDPDPRKFSVGMETADECTMYTSPFDMRATVKERWREYKHAVGVLSDRAFDPLPKTFALAPDAAFDNCLYWPAPSHRNPRIPSSANLPATLPILMLTGDLDSTTPPGDARRAQRWLGRSARLIMFPNVGHAPASSDRFDCAREIMRAFIRAPLARLDTSCVEKIPELRAVGVFPRTLADQPRAEPRSGDEASPTESRLAALAVGALGDVINAKRDLEVNAAANDDLFEIAGLRGGTSIVDEENAIITLDKVAFSRDTAVTGFTAVRYHHSILSGIAHLNARTTDGSAAEDLWIIWHVRQPHAMAMIDGYTHGHHFVHEEVPAP